MEIQLRTLRIAQQKEEQLLVFITSTFRITLNLCAVDLSGWGEMVDCFKRPVGLAGKLSSAELAADWILGIHFFSPPIDLVSENALSSSCKSAHSHNL